MFNNSQSHPIFSKHSEVMNAKPDDNDGIIRLIAEVKRRGNEAFKGQSHQEAEVLYSKAIELVHELPAKDNLHAFYSNRSAARCSMGKHDLALEDATSCIEFNPEWAKGYFRKGQALSKLDRYGEAYVAFMKAVELEPTNKGAVKQRDSAKENAMRLGQDLTGKRVEEPIATPASTTTAPKKNTASKPAAPSVSVVEEEDISDLKGHVKGYKTLADGRKTTFFNNELTDEARTLIGDIAPKKIIDRDAVQIKNVEGGSAWNQGNTFEEKEMTPWAKQRIEELALAAEYADADIAIKVNKVSDIDGDASVAVMRGKKRYIFDFVFEVECSGTFAGGVVKTGKIKYLDMSSDGDDEFEVEVLVPSKFDSAEGKRLYEMLSSSSKGLRPILLRQLKKFVSELHSH